MASTWSRERGADGRVRMLVRGEIDLADERPLIDEVDAVVGGSDDVVVELDLAGVDFIDSSGLRALLLLRRAHGERVLVGARSAPVQRVLEIAGLAEMFANGNEKG
jgi:anti-sigma B factor antagonist